MTLNEDQGLLLLASMAFSTLTGHERQCVMSCHDYVSEEDNDLLMSRTNDWE
jgi:hypothetical protein